MQDEHIQGGYILLARKMFDSWLMDKPPLWMKLWIWMLGQANWKDRDQLKRGQFITTADEMREAMSYHVGARIERPTIKEIRKAYEGLTKGGAVGRAKSTRGMVITVCNYDKYQRFESYEGQDEGHNERATKGTKGAHDTESIRKQESIKALPYVEIVEYLNEKTGKKYRASSEATKRLIRGRVAEGFTLEDFKQVIDNMAAAWLGSAKMEQYLRPGTLFKASRFDEYRNHKPPQRKADKHSALDEWAGGSNARQAMDQADDSGYAQGAKVIELTQGTSGGCFR